MIAAMVCMAASAQLPEQVETVKTEVEKYRKNIADKAYSLIAIGDADDREDVVDDIEDMFDDLENYLGKHVSRLVSSSTLHKTITVDDFYFVQTPTTVNVKYGDFSFFSTPVTYEYHDGDIEIRTTPTTQHVKTPAFLYESSPTRSTFKIWDNSPLSDTVNVREGDRLKFSTSVTVDSDSTVVVVDGNPSYQYDTTNFKYGRHNGRNRRYDYNVKFSRERRHHDFSLDSDDNTYFYIGINNFINDDDEIDNPKEKFMELNSGRSIELGFYTTIHRWKFTRFMAMDLGFDYRLRHYSFEHTFNLVKEDGVITADFDNIPIGSNGKPVEFKKHNLRQQYISIPLTMEWRLGDYYNPFILSAGIEGSLRIGSREKQVYKIDDDRKVNRNRNDFETNLLRYACTFGIGYRRFELYCNYSPMELFKHNHGPELYPISIGARFLID